MKKLLLTSGLMMFLACNIFAQAGGTTFTLTTTSTPATVCNGTSICDGTASVVVTGGTPSYTYNWSTTPSQTTQTATGLCPGTYTVTVYDSSPGPSPKPGTTATVTVICNSNPNGINSVSVDDNITVFPIPARSDLNIQFNAFVQGKVELSFRSILGTVVYQDEFEVTGLYNMSVDISALPNGIYTMEFATDRSVITKQFIKQ